MEVTLSPRMEYGGKNGTEGRKVKYVCMYMDVPYLMQKEVL